MSRISGRVIVFDDEIEKSDNIEYCCREMSFHINGNEIYLNYSPKFREYRIPYKEECGGGEQIIKYCPWCGKKLAQSLRDVFFNTLEEMGFDEPFEQEIPAEFKTDEWWKKRNL